MDEATRQKISRSCTGRKHTKETCEKMSKTKTGVKLTTQHRNNISAGMRRWHQSKAIRAEPQE